MSYLHRHLAAAVLAGGVATAHAAGDVRIATGASSVEVAAGASATIAIHLHNAAAEASDPTPIRLVASNPDWTFATNGETGCGAVQQTQETGVFFDIPSLLAGSTLDCNLTATRPAGVIDDTQLQVWTELGFNEAVLVLGTFADIALGNERVSYSVDPDGTTHGVFRLIAKNIGAIPVEPFNAATCTYEHTFDNAIEGGCTPTTSQCARGMVPYVAQGAHLPALAPGEQTSCLISVRGTTQSSQLDVLYLDQDPHWNVWLIDAANGGDVYDPHDADNQTSLMAPAPAGAGIQAAPTLSPLALALLAGSLFAAAWKSRRDGHRLNR